MYETEQLLRKFDQETSEWVFQSTQQKKAILLISLYLDTGINWDYRSDITATRVLATLYHERLRAHKEGVYFYSKGHWRKILELPEEILHGLEKIFNVSQIYFFELSNLGTEKAWRIVFDTLMRLNHDSTFDSYNIASNTRHWAGLVGKTLRDLLAR